MYVSSKMSLIKFSDQTHRTVTLANFTPKSKSFVVIMLNIRVIFFVNGHKKLDMHFICT